ncbi:MAG: DUF1906 domain-containing protein [Pseudobutyrivibrio ruminis]|uniref:glycoside hydrolase domain-containing protein n=1 Tax=Pseudobutyrivibrio ruminis TaxID=46206 RepID=UPI0026E965DC|nr:glycoside hydrolase domain-containing protein [Pseudobutyrivibrio ruminis]MBE5912885.1 DUF1906 domain-containing protein [Pseudobutyrivibrio ruminis]MBE6025066.1 DUF1906 domain-containing protein [Cellulosilyticum sp.]
MDEMVKATQEWLNKTYKGEKDFTPFAEKDIDGITGAGTFKRLIQALQIEINKQYGKNIKVDGDFGDGTLKALPATIGKSNTKNNIVHIIQSSLWCKGYSAGAMDGIYGKDTSNAVMKFQSDAGIENDGIIRPYILKGIMNTDGYKVLNPKDTDAVYKSYVQQGMNKYYGQKIGLSPTNGLWERKAHKNLIKCCQLEWGLDPDGVFGTNTMNAAPTLTKKTKGYTASKRLLKWALTVNGYYPYGLNEGVFDDKTYNAIYEFQDFLRLGADGMAGKNTWASLLSSRGNTARKATACDTSTRLSRFTATDLKNAGYTDVGRYLTNVEGGTLDKKMTEDEIAVLGIVDLNIIPIFQTTGRKNTYFTEKQGKKDAIDATAAAVNLGFPKNSVIYFAADYDVLTKDIEEYLIPYFKSVNDNIGCNYRVGVYGPRMLCNHLYEKKLAEYSYVSDMSSGFTGNIGQKMPKNWAYDQFFETNSLSVAIDKCIASERATAIPAKKIKNNNSFNIYTLYDNLWNYAEKYLQSAGKETSIKDINVFILQYLRGHYEGTGWDILGGTKDKNFEMAVNAKNLGIADTSKEILVSSFDFFDSNTAQNIEIEHLAATLNACIYNTLILAKADNKIDAYAGWAGDLHQMAAAVESNKDSDVDATFSLEALKRKIAANDDKYGFSKMDLLQDVDAFNMAKLYDWKNNKIHDIFNDYYNLSDNSYNRYSLFKREMLSAFGKKTIKDIALPFANGEYKLYTDYFESNFGKYPYEYGEVIAEAFDSRIEDLVNQ